VSKIEGNAVEEGEKVFFEGIVDAQPMPSKVWPSIRSSEMTAEKTVEAFLQHATIELARVDWSRVYEWKSIQGIFIA